MTPELTELPPIGAGFVLTVDVEEWYHTCLVPAYVDPALRPAGLAQELDFLLPELLDLLAQKDRKATFFVLGEVAERWPARVREIAAAGHEIGSHSTIHLRAGERTPAQFARDVGAARAALEDLLGQPVLGFRAPEWSLRHPGNPRLVALAEAGYVYDSSLAPFVGAGRWSNPRRPYRLSWSAGRELLELPPLTFGGPLRLPAGSWPGRLASPERIAAAAHREHARGGLPVMVVHPWEVSGRPTPGPLSSFARFVHETGRPGYREKFSRLLESAPWQPASTLLPRLRSAVPAAPPDLSSAIADGPAAG